MEGKDKLKKDLVRESKIGYWRKAKKKEVERDRF